jgi:asparagine synthase (glutamine-hydrolysing)
MSIDPVAKQWQGGPEKAMLRVAFRDLLPDAILWRRKAEFAAGCGFEPILGQHADALVSDADLRNAREADPTLSKEALWYRRLFEERFPGAGPRGVVGRWRGRAGSSWGEA